MNTEFQKRTHKIEVSDEELSYLYRKRARDEKKLLKNGVYVAPTIKDFFERAGLEYNELVETKVTELCKELKSITENNAYVLGEKRVKQFLNDGYIEYRGYNKFYYGEFCYPATNPFAYYSRQYDVIKADTPINCFNILIDLRGEVKSDWILSSYDIPDTGTRLFFTKRNYIEIYEDGNKPVMPAINFVTDKIVTYALMKYNKIKLNNNIVICFETHVYIINNRLCYIFSDFQLCSSSFLDAHYNAEEKVFTTKLLSNTQIFNIVKRKFDELFVKKIKEREESLVDLKKAKALVSKLKARDIVME